jgi:hypothetical protein
MVPEELATKYIKAIKDALKQFGSYAYDDKGPREVMDIDEITDELGKLSTAEVSATFKLVLEKSKGKRQASQFISACLVHMQEWEHFDELMDKHAWLDEHF